MIIIVIILNNFLNFVDIIINFSGIIIKIVVILASFKIFIIVIIMVIMFI